MSALLGTRAYAQLDFVKDFVRLNDSVYICNHEITNAEFAIFAKDPVVSGKWNAFRYDSTLWVKNFSGAQAYTNTYHWHEGFAQYPVVNIPHFSATYFCTVLDKTYNDLAQKPFASVSFRLPTEQEWLAAYKPTKQSSDPKKRFNLKWKAPNANTYDYIADGYVYTNPVTAYSPNALGIYGMMGNVSEMLSAKGNGQTQVSVIGGSFDDVMSVFATPKSSVCQTPNPRVGFRVVMEVHRK